MLRNWTEEHMDTPSRLARSGSFWKRVVEVYDYVDGNILMLARMYGRRLKGYGNMGYKIIADAKFPRLLTL